MTNGNHEGLDYQIALLRRQVSELTELAAAASGSAQEENLQDRINEQQERLNQLLQQRSGTSQTT